MELSVYTRGYNRRPLYMKKIPLTQGKYAVVDDSDYKLVSGYKWYFDGKYARRRDYKSGKQIRMHRQILGDSMQLEVDHANGDGLDNRRSNIRICTRSQNGMNKKIQRNNTSGYRGVSWWSHGNKWKATIRINKKPKHVLYSKDPKEAAEAYNKAALEHYGQFALLNKI